jgi:tRNA nucleotidyltransferase/poly(A) polymerase
MTKFPKARLADLVMIEVADVVVVQDAWGAELARLDPDAADVLRHCSGEYSIDELAAHCGFARETVFAALDRLADLSLIEARSTPPSGVWSRRGVLKDAALLGGLAGLGVALPAAAEESSQARESEVKHSSESKTKKVAAESDAKVHEKAAREQQKKAPAEQAMEQSRKGRTSEEETAKARTQPEVARESAEKRSASQQKLKVGQTPEAAREESRKKSVAAEEQARKNKAQEEAQKSPH